MVRNSRSKTRAVAPTRYSTRDIQQKYSARSGCRRSAAATSAEGDGKAAAPSCTSLSKGENRSGSTGACWGPASVQVKVKTLSADRLGVLSPLVIPSVHSEAPHMPPFGASRTAAGTILLGRARRARRQDAATARSRRACPGAGLPLSCRVGGEESAAFQIHPSPYRCRRQPIGGRPAVQFFRNGHVSSRYGVLAQLVLRHNAKKQTSGRPP